MICRAASVEAPGRVELPTNGLGNRCSIHLSYGALRRNPIISRQFRAVGILLRTVWRLFAAKTQDHGFEAISTPSTTGRYNTVACKTRLAAELDVDLVSLTT